MSPQAALQSFNRGLASVRTLLKRDEESLTPVITADERSFLEGVVARGTAEGATLAGKFPDLERAVKLGNEIRRRRPGELPATLDLDTGQPPVSLEDQNRVSVELADFRRVFADQLAAIQPSIDRVELLVSQGKFRTAQAVLNAAVEAAKIRDKTMGVGAAQGTRDTSARETELKSADFLPRCVLQLTTGQFDDSRRALEDLMEGKTSLSTGERNAILKNMIDAVFASDAVPGMVDKDPEFFAALLTAAARLAANKEAVKDLKILRNFLSSLHMKLGSRNSMVCASLLAKNWMSPHLMDKDLYTSMLAGIDVADWNKSDNSLAAKGFNMLWHAKEYGTICKLVEKGVDTMQAGAYGRDTGRSREGMWSGFIQPLEHLMGNYIRLTSLPDTHPDVVTVGPGKVAGARDILLALGAEENTSIMTSYSEYQGCEMLLGFPDDPGTIWGFEDVRLPYVQAAHDTAPGKQPLRMWEMWEAVDLALNKDGYASLLRDPENTIRKVVAQGRAKVREGRAARPMEYYGRTTDEFLQEFEDECTSYLTFLSEQTPTAKFATTELAGRRIEKAMGGLGCKAGLWWAKQIGVPVYYCLDGLRIQDAIDYKTYKTKRINDALAAPGNAKYGEVITLAEVREILTHWDDLKGTVKFVKQGKIMKGDDLKKVDEWIARMKESDGRAPRRQAPPVKVFRDQLDMLDPTLVWSVDRHDAMEIVAKADLIKLAADAQRVELLPEVLDDCRILFWYGLLPEGLADALRTMYEAEPEDKEIRAEMVKEFYLKDVCEALAVPLGQAVDRWLGTAIQPYVPEPVAKKVEKEVEKVEV